ncbi:MAG: SWIM zinc finger family protein, partial [Rhodospirillales bacterium]|nr:SWIM zinc finger family protein [Rhodospirillales bacterium]
MLDKLDETEIVTLFGKTIAERGRRYRRDGAVKYLEVSDDHSTLTAEVEGSEAEPYEVELAVLPRKSGFTIRGSCTCPYGMGCKHMAAALYEMLHRRQVRSPAMTRPATQDMLMDESVSLWLSQLSAASQPRSTEFIVYLLSLSPHGTPDLNIEVTRILKAGGYGQSRKIRIDQLLRGNANYITEEDRMLGYLLSSGVYYGASLPSIPQMVDMALTRMIETGRGRWLRHDAPPLRLGPARPGRVNWELGPDGCQRPVLEAEGLMILKAASPWYVDPQGGEAGPLDFGMSAAALRTLMQAPPISPSQAGRVAAALQERVGQARVQPPRADVREEVLTEPPVPCLTLAMLPSLAPGWGTTVVPGPRPVAYLSYAYGEVAVDPRTAPRELRRAVNGRILRIRRDMRAERKAATRLGKSGLSQYLMPNAGNSPGLPYHFHDNGESSWLDFLHSGVPALEAEGWRIVTAPDFALKVARDAEFDADLSESGGLWFSMDLGIEVEGRRLPLLPMLVALLKSLPSDTDLIQALKAKSRNNVIYL